MFIQIHNNIINSEQIVSVMLDAEPAMIGGKVYCLRIQFISSGLSIKGTEQEVNDAYAKIVSKLIKE